MPPREWIANAAFMVAMETVGRRARNRLLREARNPALVQKETLHSILRLCAKTEQGRNYGLTKIGSIDDFRQKVPIHNYEDIRPAIERQINSGALSIAPDRPLMYARSTGTTGAPKYIPVTRQVLSELKYAQRAMAFAQHEALHPFAGKLVGLAGATSEERLAGGATAGATSGLIYETMPRFMHEKYLIPPAMFDVPDYDLKYRLIARLAIQDPDVSVIATANPSTILRLMETIREELPRIVQELRTGSFSALTAVSPEIAKGIVSRIRSDPQRADALSVLLPKIDQLILADLWPGLRLVMAWLGGGCALAAETVKRQLPVGATMVDAGYVASEMRGTIVVDIARGLALPLLGDVFFEFIPIEAWEAGARTTILLHEMEQGRNYHVIVTTAAGLLRYHMNDVVRATQNIENTPTLEFVRKGRGVTNITGEKVSEDQIHSAMAILCKRSGMIPAFFIVVADVKRSGYFAYVEHARSPVEQVDLAAILDDVLGELNIEYAAKRASRRLARIEIVKLRSGAGNAYHRHCVEYKGQREAQAKVLALQTAEECDFDFSAFEIENDPVNSPGR